MRQFKFRVWHKTQKRWLDTYAEEDPMMDLNGEVYLYERESRSHTNFYTMPSAIVIQQWTGLQDKNGKDIYEGDVVIGCYPSDQYGKIIRSPDGAYQINNDYCEHILIGFCDRVEVVGNIFDEDSRLATTK